MLVLSLLIACTDGERAVASLLSAHPFDEVFSRIDSIVLEQPDAYPIINPTGFDIGPDGIMVLADAGEARVSVFDSTGRLVRAIGRRGEGPGEFQHPRSPVVDSMGRIHVIDTHLRRLYVFGFDGTLLHEVPTPTDRMVTDMALATGGYLIASESALGTVEDDVLSLIDSTGVVRWEALPLEALYPGGVESPRWRTISAFRLIRTPSEVFVSAALFDSLWTVDVRTGVLTESQAITVPGYEPPTLPDVELRGIEQLSEWAGSQMRAAALAGDGELIVVPFTKGRYMTDDKPGIAALRTPNREWMAVEDLPVVVHSRGRRIYTLERPDWDVAVIGIYEWREPRE